jgi:secreted trypsin-like serine protease
MEDGFEAFDVTMEVPHPLWDNNAPEYDVMLVKLSGQATHPVLNLNSESSLPGSEPEDGLNLIGFAFDSTGEIADDTVLNEVFVNYTPNEVCETLEDFDLDYSLAGIVNGQWLCADDDDKGACFGDGGNPLVLNGGSAQEDIQVGVAAA